MKSRFFSKRLIATFVALVMVATMVLPVLVACGKKGSTDYTYNEYIQQFPNSWSTHNATTDADMYVQGYTETGLYAYTLSADRSTYAFVDEMAKGDPQNVTESYKGQYGIDENENTADSNVGKAWEITLNPDATWENGEKITADDYVWSMERVLSPEMRNSLSATYITGETAIYNAKNYYNGSSTLNYEMIPEVMSNDDVAAAIAEKSLYFSLSKGTPIVGRYSLQYYHDLFERNSRFFRKDKSEDPAVRDWYAYLLETYGATADELGYILVTESNVADIKEGMTILAENLGTSLADWTLTLSRVSNVHPEYTLIGEEKTDAQIDELIAAGKLYISLNKSPIVAGKYTMQYHHDLLPRNARFYREGKSEDPNDRDWYAYLLETYGSTANDDGYIKLTTGNLADIKEGMTVVATNIGLTAWYNALSILEYVENEEVPFEEVGIFKTGDKNDTFVIVFENAVTKYQVKNLLTKNWIVYKPYYEEGYTRQGSLTLTTYGAIGGKYMGYGPYKLASFQKDKELVFKRNKNWYGYNEDATNYHEGEFMTDRIVCQVVSDQATALLEFEKGNIDSVRLTANDMDKYKFSDYLLKRTGGNTWSINFNSDVTKLADIEKDGNGNRRILSVYEFRKALSLCLDRAYIGQNILVGSAPAYSFINSNYYYDLENDANSIYRNSSQAKQAIVDLYGVEYGADENYKTLDEAYRAISGYDIDAAKSLFTEAYDKAIAEELYTNGQNIKIIIYNNAVSSMHTALANYIQQQVNEATKGTALANKISVEFKESSTRLDDMKNGNVEAIYHSYIADYNNPNGMIAKFTDLEANTSVAYGFDPTNTTFDITFDFDGDDTAETVTKTYNEWQKSIAAGGTYATASNEVRLAILSKLEYNLLNNFQTLPLAVGTDLTLRSKKVNYATDNANIFVAFGGVRLMTYNYNDGEWAKFCKESSNLSYT